MHVDEEVAFTRQGKGDKSDSEYGESRNNQAFGEHGRSPFSFFCSVAGVLPPVFLMRFKWARNASQ